jgi:hypothetical protein
MTDWARARHRLRVLEAIVLLLAARVLRKRVAMRRWSGLLGATGPVRVGVDVGPLAGAEAAVGRAVASGARRTSANCLEQAVAASLMLRARRTASVVVIGLDAQRPTDVPHAWLVGQSGTVVVGGDVVDRFRPVSQFGHLR